MTEKKWFLVDAKDKVVGRLATQIATVLIGKNKRTYTPGTDNGDFVVVINSDSFFFVRLLNIIFSQTFKLSKRASFSKTIPMDS